MFYICLKWSRSKWMYTFIFLSVFTSFLRFLALKFKIYVLIVIILFGLTMNEFYTLFFFPRRLANAIKVMLTISIYICYALSNFVAFDIMWRSFQKEFKIKTRKTLWSLGLRTLIVMTTCKYIISSVSK